MFAHVRRRPQTLTCHTMDFTEVPVSEPPGSGKKKKGKFSKRKRDDQERSGKDGGVEKKEAKMEPPAATETATTAFPPTFSVSEIKNKQRRHFMFMKLKQEKRKVKTEQQLVDRTVND